MMTDLDFKGNDANEAIARLFDEYASALGTKPLLDDAALNAVFQNAKVTVAQAIPRNGFHLGGTIVCVTWAVILAAALTMQARFQSAQAKINQNHARMAIAKQLPSAPIIKPDTVQKKTADENRDEFQLSDFRLSALCYDSHLNIDSVVRVDPRLGKGWRQASFEDVEKFCNSPDRVDSLIKYLHLPLLVDRGAPGGSDTANADVGDSLQNVYVTKGGRRYLIEDTSGWHYFISRWDHHKPKWWQQYGQIDRDHIVLGAWTGLNIRVLGVRKR